jgi:hypothetical protein
MVTRRVWVMASCLVATATFVACGARTGLDDDVAIDEPDAGQPRDAGSDVVVTDDCADAGLSYLWVITAEGHLFRFDPSSATFEQLGMLDCNTGIPNSMAVARNGAAYVSPYTGKLFRISTLTPHAVPFGAPPIHCVSTPFQVDQDGFKSFGMGYATDDNGPTETLYVAQNSGKLPSTGLAKINTETYELEFIGPFSADLGNGVEPSGTGDGRLFGLFVTYPSPVVRIAEIDKTNGNILSNQEVKVPIVGSIGTFAFAFWAGDFYLFTSSGMPGTPSVVTHFVPSTGQTRAVQTLPNEFIVGAGVSTCAPLVPGPLMDRVGDIKSR